jgi:putative membrane protein
MQPLQALGQTQPPIAPERPWMWNDGFGWQYWWICPLMMLFMIAIFATIFFVVRSSAPGWSPPWRSPGRAALEVLSERFARGEIQRDEYEEKKAAILSRERG